jgi:hypothetical protein
VHVIFDIVKKVFPSDLFTVLRMIAGGIHFLVSKMNLCPKIIETSLPNIVMYLHPPLKNTPLLKRKITIYLNKSAKGIKTLKVLMGKAFYKTGDRMFYFWF